MSIKVNGLMIKLKGKEYISTKMVPNTLGNGSMISSTDMDIKSGLMEPSMRETLSRV